MDNGQELWILGYNIIIADNNHAKIYKKFFTNLFPIYSKLMDKLKISFYNFFGPCLYYKFYNYEGVAYTYSLVEDKDEDNNKQDEIYNKLYYKFGGKSITNILKEFSLQEYFDFLKNIPYTGESFKIFIINEKSILSKLRNHKWGKINNHIKISHKNGQLNGTSTLSYRYDDDEYIERKDSLLFYNDIIQKMNYELICPTYQRNENVKVLFYQNLNIKNIVERAKQFSG